MEATYEPNRRAASRSTEGPVPLEVGYLFEGAPEGTRPTASMGARPKGLFRPVGPVFGKAADRRLRDDPRMLKGFLLEARNLATRR